MADIIRFTSPTTREAVVQAVYLKARWADEWVEYPDLWCAEASWLMAPSMSTAQLVYRYGEVKRPGDAAFGRLFPLSRLRYYVAVEFYTHAIGDEATLRTWYGIIDAAIDQQFAPELAVEQAGLTAYPRGRNHFLAYGLESLLAVSWVDRAAVENANGEPVIVPRGLTFNVGLAEYHPERPQTYGEGNRSTQAVNGGYVFHGSRTGGSIWSTADIVPYLLKVNVVRDHADEQQVPFVLEDPDNALYFWDQNVVESDGQTVWELFNRLMARQRGLAWRCEVRPAENGQGPDRVAVVPCTFLADLLIVDTIVIGANHSQVILSWEQDRGADVAVKRDSMDTVDQVIVQGEVRTSTATFSFIDGTLAKGWDASLETAYELGASGAGDYPAGTETDERIQRNNLARASDKYASVFARFVPVDPMEGYVGDGTSGVADQVLMPSDDDPDTPTPHAPQDQRFLPQLALLKGVDYGGNAITFGPGFLAGAVGQPLVHLPPLVVFPLANIDPADAVERYAQPEKNALLFATAAGEEMHYPPPASVRVAEDGALWVTVTGWSQHLIADSDFSPLAEDADDYEDGHLPADYQEMLATLSVPWSQRAEVRYPEEAPYGQDAVRVMRIDAPFHRVDYVVAGTVVALDAETGELVRSTDGGFIRDDRDKMTHIARVAYEWYGQARQAIQFSTSLVNNALQLGDLVVSAGDPALEGNVHTFDVNTVITSIRIVSPLAEAEGDAPAVPLPPRIEYRTDFGELDVLGLFPAMRQR